uniref:Uncharacterized protein n=1 Tax=uncultured Elusimicrobia bacterium TaxID=699876 RepID=A0A650EN80_9BACT|nr:hypothetical protein Elusimicrob1349_1180 [uncultured Elusimicrobia bacterium]
MSIVVPEYKNRVTLQAPRAAGAGVSGPNAAAFENKSAQIAAETVQKIGQEWAQTAAKAQERREKRQSAKRLSDAMLGYERENDELLNGKLDENGNQIEEGLLAKQLDNASSVAKTYYEKGAQIKEKYLAMAKTQDEYDYLNTAFSRGFQDRYDRTVRHQLTEERKSADRAAQAYFDTAAGAAGAITRPQDMRAHLDAVYKISDENAQGKGLSAEEQKLNRYALANANMTAAVQGAVFNGNLSAAKGMLTNLKKDLLPADWNKLNWYVTHAEEAAQKDAARAGSSAVKGDDLLYQRAIIQLAKDPNALQAEIKGAGNNLYAFQQRFQADTGLTVSAKELKTYLDWAQKMLDDPDGTPGQQKRANFAASQTAFDAFEIGGQDDGYKVYNKDLDSPSALAQETAKLRAQIVSGAFTQEDAKKAQSNLDELRRALGYRIMTKPESSWFSTSGDEFLQGGINKLAGAPDGGELAVEDLAGMYEDALALARERNLDLEQSYKTQQAHFDKLLTDVRVRYAAAKYGVPAGVADAALYNNRILALTQGENVAKPAGASALQNAVKAYQAGEWNGGRVRVKKNGDEIVDIYYED